MKKEKYKISQIDELSIEALKEIDNWVMEADQRRNRRLKRPRYKDQDQGPGRSENGIN